MLLLRVAAVAITGAAALISLRRYHREQAIASLRRELRNALHLLDDPPAVLVAGFRAHGKSSFVNTACRALSAESGPLILRTQTAPGGGATLERRVVRAPAAAGPPDGPGGAEQEEDDADDGAAVDLVDAPPFPEPPRLTDADVEAALAGAPTAECVVLVLRCGGPSKKRHVAFKKLAEVANSIRQRGLQFMVVLTRKNDLKSKREALELHRKVVARARTDCVYFLENYVADEMFSFESTKNQFETHFTALVIMRQCVEFVKLYRSNNSARSKKNENDVSSRAMKMSIK